MSGYSQTELDDIQAKWDLRFPPDLRALLRERRYVIDHEDPRVRSFDWITEADDVVRASLDWPLEGFLFDIGQGLWWPEWGEMPERLDAREDKLRTIFAAAPKLIPVYGHRYIPQDPFESGNPIFSVWQMDVIPYGADLDHYVLCENPFLANEVPWPPIKDIPFWSRAVEFNNARFQGGAGFAFFNTGGVLPEPG